MTCLSLHAAAPAPPNYFLRTWQTKQGLPNNAVTAILQTRDGYLWVGTYDGLARFDGATFKVFDNNNTPEMRSSRVVSLFENYNGDLWTGFESGELTQYRDGQFHAVPFNPGWENRSVLNIGADHTGRIWLLNEEGRLAGVDGGLFSVTNAGTSSRVAVMARNDQGTIRIAYGGRVFGLENNQLVPLTVGAPPGERKA